MVNQTRDGLIKELNKTLKYASNCDISEITEQGDAIRVVFFTMFEQNFTPEEIAAVFNGVEISDEKIALIEANDQYRKR